MRPTTKLYQYPAPTAKLSSAFNHTQPSNRTHKSLSLLTLLASVILLPLSAQAALPQAIEAALSRANLSTDNISIIITPVGDKNASRLPAPIQVIDSSSTDIPSNADDKHPKINANKSNTKYNNSNNDKKPLTQPSALVTIEQQTIKKHEQNLHAYTDDPYTYQSIESIPTILEDKTKLAGAHDANGSGQNSNKNSNAITNKPSVKISFSPLLSYQPDIARTPASTMKLVPSFIALDTLGADFIWYTRVYHTGIIIGDRLYGDLIIQGSGDPKMTHERLQQLLYKVQKSGIRHIDGNIVVDSAVFKSVSKDPAAFDNAPLRPYNASPDGFLVNFSTIGIKSYPLNNGQASLTYTPQLANYNLPNKIDMRSAACGQARYSLAPQWQTQQLVLNTDLPNSCQEHAFYVAYPDAKDFAARVIGAKWEAMGNTLSGNVISQGTSYAAKKSLKVAQGLEAKGLAALSISPLPIVSYPSLNLTQQIHDINHFSNNVMTEQVALSIGAYSQANNNTNSKSNNEAVDKTVNKGIGKVIDKQHSLYQFGKPPATDYPAALQTINQWWQTNLSTPPPHLTNGSGLCRDCTISAANLSELLTYAYDHPSFDAYVSSLGIAGVSGTISAHSERLPESQAIGRSWIKTGTLNNVTSMAGYVKGLSGQDYVVVGLINSEQSLNAYTARPVLDAMLDWTAQH